MDQETTKKLGDYLFQRRKAMEYKEGRTVSQSEIAEKANIPQATYNKYEMGKVPPNDKNMHKLAAFWGIEIYEICGGPVMMPNNKVLRQIVKVWGKLPEDVQKKFRDQILDSAAEWEDRKPNFNRAAIPES